MAILHRDIAKGPRFYAAEMVAQPVNVQHGILVKPVTVQSVNPASQQPATPPLAQPSPSDAISKRLSSDWDMHWRVAVEGPYPAVMSFQVFPDDGDNEWFLTKGEQELLAHQAREARHAEALAGVWEATKVAQPLPDSQSALILNISSEPKAKTIHAWPQVSFADAKDPVVRPAKADARIRLAPYIEPRDDRSTWLRPSHSQDRSGSPLSNTSGTRPPPIATERVPATWSAAPRRRPATTTAAIIQGERPLPNNFNCEPAEFYAQCNSSSSPTAPHTATSTANEMTRSFVAPLPRPHLRTEAHPVIRMHLTDADGYVQLGSHIAMLIAHRRDVGWPACRTLETNLRECVAEATRLHARSKAFVLMMATPEWNRYEARATACAIRRRIRTRAEGRTMWLWVKAQHDALGTWDWSKGPIHCTCCE